MYHPSELPVLKHIKPFNHSFGSDSTSTSARSRRVKVGPSATESSSQILSSLPPEVLTIIFTFVVGGFWDVTRRSSSNYTFIPIRQLFRGPLRMICRRWRRHYLEFSLGSKYHRGGAFVGTNFTELAVMHEWSLDIAVVGCLLFAGDPNDLLLPSIDDVLKPIRLDKQDSATLASVEAIEWTDPSRLPPRRIKGIENAVLRVSGILFEEARSYTQKTQELLLQELFSLSLSLSSKVLAFLQAFPRVKRAEIPSWVVALAWGLKINTEDQPRSKLVEDYSVPVISPSDLRDQLESLLHSLDHASIVGYPLVTGSIFHRPFGKPKTWMLRDVEVMLSRFLGSRFSSTMDDGFKSTFSSLARRAEVKLQSFQGRRGVTLHGYPLATPFSTIDIAKRLLPLEVTGLTEIYVAEEAAPSSTLSCALLEIPTVKASATTLQRLTLHVQFTGSASTSRRTATPRHHCPTLSIVIWTLVLAPSVRTYSGVSFDQKRRTGPSLSPFAAVTSPTTVLIRRPLVIPILQGQCWISFSILDHILSR
ncbi:hypothetical protein CC2G_005163 [Coprinopsis cinerea AmutBmut pab1-1]|nr:hypothetical protein CC2G_005163 [Coprinopsis cinerea AmutBmut pab1-1]